MADNTSTLPKALCKLLNPLNLNEPDTSFPDLLSDALKFNDELFVLADILFENKEQNIPDKTFEDELRELLATKTTLNSENITQAIYFISGLEKLQKMQNL